MKKSTKLLAVLAVTAILGTAAAETPASYYTDVPPHHWAATAVNTLSGEGVLLGNPDGTFGGTTLLSRYELAMILHRFYTHQNQRDATPVDDLVQQVDELTTEVERLTSQNSDLFNLIEQLMATHNVEASALNSRIKHLETVTDVLQTLSTTVVAGPPGPPGPAGPVIYLDANGNPIEHLNQAALARHTEENTNPETPVASTPVSTPVVEAPAEPEATPAETHTAADDPNEDLEALSTAQLVNILNSRADRQELMQQIDTRSNDLYALY